MRVRTHKITATVRALAKNRALPESSRPSRGDDAAQAGLPDIDKGHPGIYNIADPSGYRSVEEARSERG